MRGKVYGGATILFLGVVGLAILHSPEWIFVAIAMAVYVWWKRLDEIIGG